MRVHMTSLSLVLQEKSAKQQLSTFFSIFVHFIPFLHDYDVKKKMPNFAFFMENVNQARPNFILFRVSIWSLGIQLQVLLAHI